MRRSIEWFYVKIRKEVTMPLFSSASPFDQDVGKLFHARFNLLSGLVVNEFLFPRCRKSDQWTQHVGRLADLYGYLWSNSEIAVRVSWIVSSRKGNNHVIRRITNLRVKLPPQFCSKVGKRNFFHTLASESLSNIVRLRFYISSQKFSGS